ncbi:glutamine amidotransferase [Nocardia neocaledoniensis]|uniref:glutamine amidotransferase n=1 Tax=Nocardia neocaledoniensis TaxID=236511 RepID=UPI002456829E|nr:glutamine amidotransferase [Nocardia neocaledoniensis]
MTDASPRDHGGRPFLLLATRAEDEAADQEYSAFLRYGGLNSHRLHRHRLERDPLDDLDLDDYAGIILGGSPFTISDPPEAKSPAQRRVEAELGDLVAAVVRQDFPFLGACFGIGVIGSLIGAVIDRTHPEPVGPTTITLTESGRVDPLLCVLPPEFDAFVGHKEAATELPPEAERLAFSSGCPIQAFRVGANVYATQFHPELDAHGMSTRIDAYKHHGYFDPGEAETLKEVARSGNVVHPGALVRRFVQLYED